MNTIQLERKVAALLTENIAFTESFEQKGAFNETIIKYWFEYKDDTVYPFELSIKIDKNWLDEHDKTPIISMEFSTTMAKNGLLVCFGNELLQNETRKKAVQDLYFCFEAIVLADFEEKGTFGYKRDSCDALFEGYQWFAEGKAVTSSGRFEHVPNLAFKNSTLWQDEKAYKKATVVAEGTGAKRYIRYFLTHNQCKDVVKAFLESVLDADKEVRITNEASFWNYTFVIRPDMLHFDSKTLSNLGKMVAYNHQDKEETLHVARYVFELFGEHSVVNLCLDETTIKQLNAESDSFEENPALMREHLLAKIEKLNKKSKENKEYEQYEEKYHRFLDGLLDLHSKYESLYSQLGETSYKKRAEKAKRLWLRYTN